MRVALQAEDVIVVDDVLAPAPFAALCDDIGNGEYQSVHARRWDKAWRLWDGTPLRATPVFFDPSNARREEGARYPTGSAVDGVFDALRTLTAEHPQIAGREGVDWAAMFLAPWLYPVGSALALHRDGGSYSGAFTFFAHPRWGLHWGGELLILEDAAPAAHELGGATWLADEDDLVTGTPSAIATCIFPRPNRLALIGPGRPHMIRRVDANAGAHVRSSLAGFFLRS